MKYEIEILQTVTYETEKLQDILDKFYSECSWHLSVTVKDKDDKELILHLEVNDMEANIMTTDSEWHESERYTYYEDDIEQDIKDCWLDFNSIKLI